MKYNEKIYYQDESEEVFGVTPPKCSHAREYKYIHTNKCYRFFSFVVHKIFLTPLAFVYCRIIRRIRYVNKQALREFRSGCFVYANHVATISDAVSPSLICRKKPYIIVNPINTTIPFLGGINRLCGALPLPHGFNSSKRFISAINRIIQSKNPIIIYPEASLWPFYTKIRNFDDRSFRYPINLNVPVFVFTTTFMCKKEGKKPRVVIYIDGPIYPEMTLDKAERQKRLRDSVYNKMIERAQNSNYEYVQYIKRG